MKYRYEQEQDFIELLSTGYVKLPSGIMSSVRYSHKDIIQYWLEANTNF